MSPDAGSPGPDVVARRSCACHGEAVRRPPAVVIGLVVLAVLIAVVLLSSRGGGAIPA